MQYDEAASTRAQTRRAVTLQAYRAGPLAPYLKGTPALEIGDPVVLEHAPTSPPPTRALRPHMTPVVDASQAVVFAGYQLQAIPDYRVALQAWYRAVRMGGHLVVVVPHAFLFDRQAALPARWMSSHRRLYTPASLLEEVEEALVPNSYRIRLLCDDDAGYDYRLDRSVFPAGQHDILMVLERTEVPAWTIDADRPAQVFEHDFAFEPPHTRVEADRDLPHGKILILKLDHLGDFIMGVPALERARSCFPDAEITLVVGSWNQAMAERLGLFDRVIAFDVFPRNSSEEVPDVLARVAAFDRLVTDQYDLAIDLRTDSDTRVLLRNVQARTKAGIGSKTQFDHLDIFLPIDRSRHSEAARDDEIPARDFSAQVHCSRNRFQISCKGEAVRRHEGAIVWGPYRELSAGRYLFEPFIELDPRSPGLLELDIGIDRQRMTTAFLSENAPLRMTFSTDHDDSVFEFRVWSVGGEPVPDFQFYGGRLIKQGASSVLHQSEYLSLLIELVSMRVDRFGILRQSRSSR